MDNSSDETQVKLTPEQEKEFALWIKALPWYREFKERYGEYPNINDPQYDYRAAFMSGVKPERYEFDENSYHWPSMVDVPMGRMLKSSDHGTAWMQRFMEEYGIDPHAAGAIGLLGPDWIGNK